MLAAKGLELFDIKIEFGYVDNEIALIDEIGSSSMRVYKNCKALDPKSLTAVLLGE